MEYIGIDGGVGMVPKGQQGTLFNNSNAHIPAGGIIMQALGQAGVSTEFQQEIGLFGLGILPAIAGLDSFPMFVCVDEQADNDRERTRVISGGRVPILIEQTSGAQGTKIYAQKNSHKASITISDRQLGVTLEDIKSDGTPTLCLFYGNTP